MILPLYAGLDRSQPNVLEAARDLGAGRSRDVPPGDLPLSLPAIVAAVLLTCLPMLGDYFTADLLSASPSTSMVGNLINNSVLAPGQTGQAGAFVLLVLWSSLVPMLFYVRVTSRRRRGRDVSAAARAGGRVSAAGGGARGGRRASCRPHRRSTCSGRCCPCSWP